MLFKTELNGFEPSKQHRPFNALAGRPDQPLWHNSKIKTCQAAYLKGNLFFILLKEHRNDLTRAIPLQIFGLRIYYSKSKLRLSDSN